MNERALAVLEPRDFTELATVGDYFAQSGLFPDAKTKAQAIVRILAGRELGFGAFASMSGVHIIQGKATYSANLMAAAIKRHPSPRYDYRITEHTDKVCALDFYQDGELVGTERFSIEDANRAGLLNNPSWKKYPKNMLFARAISNGAKFYCPDVFGAPVYTPEELGAPVNEDGDVIEGEVISASVAHQEPQQAASAGVPVATPETSAEKPLPAPANLAPSRRITDKPRINGDYSPDEDDRPLDDRKTWPQMRQAMLAAGYARSNQHALNTLKVATNTQSTGWAGILGKKLTIAQAWSMVVDYRAFRPAGGEDEFDAAPAEQGALVTTEGQNAIDALAL